MKQKIVTVGYGDVKKVQIEARYHLLSLEDLVLLKIETMLFSWLNLSPRFAKN